MRDEADERFRIFDPVDGAVVFEGATKCLKAALKVACAFSVGEFPGVLLRESGSPPNRMRNALVAVSGVKALGSTLNLTSL